MIRRTFGLFLLLFVVPLPCGRAAESDWDWAPATKHWSDINTIRWSPDGSKILTAGQDGRLIIWDAKTGRQIRAIAASNPTAVASGVWSGDGSRILNGPNDYKSAVWDVASGKRVRTLFGYDLSLSCGCLNQNGSLGILGTSRNTVLIWDPKSGEIVRTLSGHTKPITVIDITKDGATAITGSDDGTAIVWDVAAGKSIATLKGHKSRIRGAALTQNGKTAVTTGDERVTIVWDVKSGTARHTMGGNFDPVAQLGCSDDGSVIITADSLTLRIWDGKTGKKTGSIDFKGHTGAIALSPDGSKYALSRGTDLGVWDVKTGERLPVEFENNGAVLCVAWHPRQPKLLVGSNNGHAMIWGFGPGAKNPILMGHRGPMRAACWDQEGKLLLTGDDDHAATLWDAETLRRLKSFPVGHWGVSSVALNRDGSQAVVAGQHEDLATLWDTKKAEKIHTFAGPRAIHTVRWSADGRRVLTAGQDSTLKIWDPKTGQLEKNLTLPHDWVMDAQFNHNGSRIAACYSSFRASITYIWDVAEGKRVRAFEGHADGVTHLCWNPDSTQLATASRDRTIILWEASGKKRHTLRGHAASITSLSWSPNGEFLASGSYDGSTRIWDVKTGQEVCRLMSFGSGKDWLVLGRDGAFDGSDGGKAHRLFRRRDTGAAVEPDQYLKKPTAGLLAQLLAR